MTKSGEVYRCNICGNMVTMLHTGKGQLVCCGKPMELLTEKTADDGYEAVAERGSTSSGFQARIAGRGYGNGR